MDETASNGWRLLASSNHSSLEIACVDCTFPLFNYTWDITESLLVEFLIGPYLSLRATLIPAASRTARRMFLRWASSDICVAEDQPYIHVYNSATVVITPPLDYVT